MLCVTLFYITLSYRSREHYKPLNSVNYTILQRPYTKDPHHRSYGRKAIIYTTVPILHIRQLLVSISKTEDYGCAEYYSVKSMAYFYPSRKIAIVYPFRTLTGLQGDKISDMSVFTAHLCGTFDNAHNFLHIILLCQRGDAYDQFTNYTMTSSITVLVFHE